MEKNEFGRTILSGRQQLRLSRARLSELIGRSVGSIRAWERGTRLPRNPDTVITLAAALNLDEGNLLRLAGLTDPVNTSQPSIEQELSTIAPSPAATSTAPVGTKPPPSSPPPPVAPPPQPPVTPTAPTTPPTNSSPPPPNVEEDTIERQMGTIFQPRSHPTSPKTEEIKPSWWSRLKLLFSGWERTRGYAHSTPIRSSEHSSDRYYLSDPSQRLFYRLRNLYTVLGLFGLLLVLVWASARGLNALSEILDSFSDSIGV